MKVPKDGKGILIGMEWYDGAEGHVDPSAPVLAIALNTGKLQLSQGVTDEKPLVLDTGILIGKLKWNHNGSVLAVSGTLANATEKDSNVVHFYSPFGKFLRGLKIPGNSINGITWEAGGLRLALAVDSFIYFANIRPDYKWGYFSNTVVFGYTPRERVEWRVIFWDVKTNEKYSSNKNITTDLQ
jgi:WD repeat-containing protein 35